MNNQYQVDGQAEAQPSAKRLGMILESITDALYAVDRDWRIIYVNHRALQFERQILGEGTHHVLGHVVWEVVPEIVGTIFDREYHRAMEEQRSCSFEARYPNRDIWFEVHVYPSPEGLSIIFRDITARKRQEEEREQLLHRQEALATIAEALVSQLSLQDVLDTVVRESLRFLGVECVAIWLANPEQRHLTLYASNGFSPDWTRDKRCISFDEPYPAGRVAKTGQLQVINDIFAPEIAARSRELYQEERIASLAAAPLFTRGRLIGVAGFGSRVADHFSPNLLGFLQTLTDLFAAAIETAQLYEQVSTALRLREEFMAAAAHELRTPVTVIKGRIQLLLKKDELGQSSRLALEATLRQTERIAHLIEDLLAIVRVRPGVVMLHRERFDLSALARAAVEGQRRPRRSTRSASKQPGR